MRIIECVDLGGSYIFYKNSCPDDLWNYLMCMDVMMYIGQLDSELESFMLVYKNKHIQEAVAVLDIQLKPFTGEIP